MCYSSQVVQGNTRELQTYGYMFDKTSFIYIEVHAVTSMSKTEVLLSWKFCNFNRLFYHGGCHINDR